MSLESMLDILKERGLSIKSVDASKIALNGPREEITEGVLEVLRAYKDELLDRFGTSGVVYREFLWANGYRQRDSIDLFGNYPVGAFWYRLGESGEWLPVPGRNEDGKVKLPF
jgi:hypothetical protein